MQPALSMAPPDRGETTLTFGCGAAIVLRLEAIPLKGMLRGSRERQEHVKRQAHVMWEDVSGSLHAL